METGNWKHGNNSRRYISVIGAGHCDAATAALAEEVGRLIARAGSVLVCGGLSGVMEAACRGAKSEGGVTLGILPDLDRSAANLFLDYSICTGIGYARNLAVVASGDAVIAVGGQFGTLSEIGHALKLERPVILLKSWEIFRNGIIPEGIFVAEHAQDAVDFACE